MDVRELSRKDLRANIGIVLQEPFLFSGTIAENIGYGRSGDPSEATREEWRPRPARGNRRRFHHCPSRGLRHGLGRGRWGIEPGPAPATLFRQSSPDRPRILILDEATSNVDTRTEAIIQKALARLLEGRTSIVIAHA